MFFNRRNHQDLPAPPPAEGETAAGSPGSEASDPLRERIVAVLKTCFDPEIPVDIYELGLIYSIEIGPRADVRIAMTLTSPMCPVAGSLPPEVEEKVRTVEGVGSVQLEVVWEPPWEPSMMSEAARLHLNMM